MGVAAVRCLFDVNYGQRARNFPDPPQHLQNLFQEAFRAKNREIQPPYASRLVRARKRFVRR